MLTARGDEADRVVGLELGADDYVPKPFSTRVLLARIKSLLRRESARRSSRPSSEVICAGELVLDPDRLEVSFSNQPVVVTVTEFRLLEVLAGKPGKVFSRDRLLDLLRGDDVVVGDRLIDTYVRRLRRKLEAVEPGFDGIETVVGAGYRWRE
jgi:DNA-binding response OmpR family regulator